MFHEHYYDGPEGMIWVRTDDGTYFGTRGDFEFEFGENLEKLPEGALERIYEPGKRHAIQNSDSIVAGGEREWSFGDRAIAAFVKLKAAQQAREKRQQEEADARGRAELERLSREFEEKNRAGSS
jgi:hypothetical protein